MTDAAAGPRPLAELALRHSSWALMVGNFAIGCGVMVVAGSLNDLVKSLQVSVALGGQLIAVAAVFMGVGAPLLAAVVGQADRRWVLSLSLLWYAAGHAAAALAPSYAALLPLRALSVLGAAVFTPQAAAAINVLAPPAERGRAIAFIFLGWSFSSVIGMPLHSYIGESFGWRWAFALVALLSLLAAAGVWRTLPAGLHAAPMPWASWHQALTDPLLIATVAVTALSSAGQFTLFSYFAPYYRQVLGADAASVSGLFFWFGAFGLLGNLLLTQWIGRFGPGRCATLALASMALSLLTWPAASTVAGMACVLIPWALGCFSTNSAQQARLGAAAPALAPALMAFNTSAIYIGQAAGAAGGGALLAHTGYGLLHWAGLAWMLVALALSLWLLQQPPARMPLEPAP